MIQETFGKPKEFIKKKMFSETEKNPTFARFLK